MAAYTATEAYLAGQIRMGKLSYKLVIARYPGYKKGIDNKLKEYGIYEFVIHGTPRDQWIKR